MRFGAYEQIVDWIKDSKEWLDAQYFNKTVKGQWNDDWNKTMGSESKVFAFSGVTTKHFACNNQEDNRMGSDSIVSERTLREIYLKGFEIAITESQPMSIMTSYNLINGVHAANCEDTCTKAARCEWGFQGMIMTDWTTTEQGEDCTASGCMRAGNDLVMPGAFSDRDNLNQELADGTLSMDDLKACISRLVNIVWQSNQFENAVPYKKVK